MPEELKNTDHLGTRVYVGEYLGKDELDPFFVDQFAKVIVTDPGARFLHVAFIPGLRMTVVFAPSLSGEISVCKKLIEGWKKTNDLAINLDPRVKDAKESWDMAEKARTSRLRLEQEEQLKTVNQFEKEYYRVRQEVESESVFSRRLQVKISKAEKRIVKMRDRAHDAFASFVSKFRYILIPKFGSDQRMFKKKKGGLSGWWRNKMGIMAHPRLRKKVEDRASKLGNSVIDPSEACSTMLCKCGSLHNQGMRHLYLINLGNSMIHNCPNEDCKEKTQRDESGRSTCCLAITRALTAIQKFKKRAGQEIELDVDEDESDEDELDEDGLEVIVDEDESDEDELDEDGLEVIVEVDESDEEVDVLDEDVLDEDESDEDENGLDEDESESEKEVVMVPGGNKRVPQVTVSQPRDGWGTPLNP
jgi:hypothetical protein